MTFSLEQSAQVCVSLHRGFISLSSKQISTSQMTLNSIGGVEDLQPTPSPDSPPVCLRSDTCLGTSPCLFFISPSCQCSCHLPLQQYLLLVTAAQGCSLNRQLKWSCYEWEFLVLMCALQQYKNACVFISLCSKQK